LQLLPPAAIQIQELLCAPVPTATEAVAENKRIIESMDAIEDESLQEDPRDGPQSSTTEDYHSVYTFATARTSNSVSSMQNAILSMADLTDLNESRLDQAHSEGHTDGHAGTFSINRDCPMDPERMFHECRPLLTLLRTRESPWEDAQSRFGIKGGQYLAVKFGTRQRVPDVPLKEYLLSCSREYLTAHPGILQSLTGLQVSACTSNARRVSLGSLLAEVSPAYIEDRFPLLRTAWETLREEHNILEALRRDKISE